jgi:hypothetical protein
MFIDTGAMWGRFGCASANMGGRAAEPTQPSHHHRALHRSSLILNAHRIQIKTNPSQKSIHIIEI